ncbi:hypothetical protein A2U01_0063589, partial [Trifolium medium]|nr:hypothetical protein [Trifolium medium]
SVPVNGREIFTCRYSDAQVSKRWSKVLRIEFTLLICMRGVYIASDAGPRLLMDVLMSSMAVNVHHSDVRRYNTLGTLSVDLGNVIFDCSAVGPRSTIGEEDFLSSP